jgi:hypothetical protein
VTRFLLLAGLMISVPAAAQTPGTPPAAGAAQTPSTPPAAAQTASTPPAAASARTFTAPVGLLFNTVRPDRVADFEKVIGYLQTALEKSGDPKDRAQAQGWRIFRATEPGPSNTVLYVFVLDPTVAGADYSLGRLLAEAYDTTQLQEIWRLYTGAVTGGGSLLNLSPVKPGTTTSPAAAPPPNTPATDRPLPPDADPNRR